MLVFLIKLANIVRSLQREGTFCEEFKKKLLKLTNDSSAQYNVPRVLDTELKK
jgi:hypothetical protein